MKDKMGDKARLLHILECITEIESAIAGETEEGFIKNHVLRIAVVKWIEIIGEAANHISKETKNSVENIEWNMIIGLRHIIVHEYFGVNYDAIWNIAVSDVPGLRQTIEKLINDFE